MRAQRSRRRKKAKSTAPVSLEQLEGISIDRRLAFEQGNLCALFDELNQQLERQLDAARAAAERDGDDSRKLESITLPYWVCRALRELLQREIATQSRGRGQSARWLKRNRTDLRDLHRYVLVRTALETGRYKLRPGRSNVFEHVYKKLRGTAFARGVTSAAIRTSYYKVEHQLPRDGATGRYYQDTIFYPRLVRGY